MWLNTVATYPVDIATELLCYVLATVIDARTVINARHSLSHYSAECPVNNGSRTIRCLLCLRLALRFRPLCLAYRVALLQ